MVIPPIMVNQYIKRVALAALAVTVSVSGDLHGREPTSTTSTSETASSINRPCVLLANDNVLFGQAHQIGEFVVVRDGESGEIQVPRKEVACWAASIRDLYQYRVDHRTRIDVSGHLRDALWCVRYDLYELAAVELKAVRKLDPHNRQADLIEARIERANQTKRPSVADVSNASDAAEEEPIRQASHQISQPIERFEPTEPARLSDVDLSTLQFFGGLVQPMLINRCGNCHSFDSGRPYSLIVPGSGGRASSRMTRENLSASLEFVDRNSPQNSELLQKAISPHGGSVAPLDPRHAKSIEALQRWLTALAQSTAQPPASASLARHPEPVSPLGQESPVQAPETELRTEQPTAPARMPRVSDPFSPDLFNRRQK